MRLGSSVESFFWPIGEAEFLERHWRKRAFASHGSSDRLAAIAEELDFTSVQGLLGSRTIDPEVRAWYYTAERQLRTVELSAGKALGMYAAGMTIYFRADLPSLQPVCEALARKLDRPAGHYDVQLFATRRSGGTHVHFDAHENFTIQLSGCKRWMVAPNLHVASPAHNFVVGNRPSEELKWYAPDGLPEVMPAGAEVHELRPGSLLYVPAGFWHATATEEDSFSLVVTFGSDGESTLAGMLSRAMRKLCFSQPEWREVSAALFGATADRARIDAALETLRSTLASISAEDVIGPSDPRRAITADTILRSNPLAYSFVRGGRDPVRIELGLASKGTIAELSVRAEHMPAFEWIRARRTPFRPSEVPAPVDQLLASLVAAGFLHRGD